MKDLKASVKALEEKGNKSQNEAIIANSNGWMDNFIIDSIHSTCITIVQLYAYCYCISSSLVLRTGQAMGQIESLGQVVPSS